MSLSVAKPAFDLRSAALVAVLAFCAYTIGLGASDLMGDPLKYALNVSYPHPPLFRGLMWASQTLFGATPFWARLPLVVIGACAVGMVWMLLRYATISRWPAAILTAGFALFPLWSVVLREGYLGSVLAACWLLAIIGIAQIEEGKIQVGLTVIFIALIGGLWGQIQNLWLVPALLVAAWIGRGQWSTLGRFERTLLVFIGVNAVVWGGYILTNPLIVGDMLFFVKDRSVNVILTPSVAFMTTALVILAIWGYRWAVRKRQPLATWEWAAGTLCLTVTPLVLYNPASWYGPYLWACLMLAVVSGLRATPRIATMPVAVLAAIILAIGSWNAWDTRQPYRAEGEALRKQFANVENVIILGTHGYEWDYALPNVTTYRWPKDASMRARATRTIIPNVLTITAEENAWIAKQKPLGAAGDGQIYAITNP